MDSYRQVRNKVNVLNSQLKKQYFTDKIAACEGNIKESWNATNQFFNERSKSSDITLIALKNLVQRLFTEKMSITMQSSFCSVGKDFAQKIDLSSNRLAGGYNIDRQMAKFYFKTIAVQVIATP